MKKKQPNKLWAIAFNKNGFWFKKPVKVTFHSSLQEYFDETGNIDIFRTGLDEEAFPTIRFASKSKKEVEVFMEGVKAAIKLNQDFWTGEKDGKKSKST